MKKIGLFVGSFNPITNSHLEIALDLLKEKTLNDIYFLSVNSSKNNLISLEDRQNLINLVKKEHKSLFSIDILHYTKSGFFNHDILEKINKDISITHLIMGSDLFFKLKTFKNYENILKNYFFIIINRNEDDVLEEIKKNYFSFKDKFIIVSKIYPYSSTMARDNLNQENINFILNKEVLAYINENHLYS